MLPHVDERICKCRVRIYTCVYL